MCPATYSIYLFIDIYRYVQKFASIQNSTEVYILKSTMQYINGLPGLSKTKMKEKGWIELRKKVISNYLYV